MLKMKWTVVSTHLYPNRGALPALKKKFVCEPLPVIFVVSIIGPIYTRGGSSV